MSAARASSKHAGETAEAAVLERVPELEYVRDVENEHVDARVADVLVPRADVPTVALPVLEVGTLVEIKSVMVVYGENQTRGRYYLREQQHRHLLEHGAVYLFAVCVPAPSRDVIAVKIVPATIVDELVSSWIDAGDRPEYAQLSWSRIFDPAEVDRAGGERP